MFRKNYTTYIQKHECHLPPPEDTVVRYIDSGFCVNTRRKIRRLLTVSDTNVSSKNYLKSSAAIRQEKCRHLQYYYHMIHPFSDGRTYWETFMMFVFFGLLVIIPVDNAVLKTNWYIKIPKLCLDLCCCIDVGITFASGYHEKNTKKIILNPQRVASRYITTYFLIDLLSSFPVDLVVFTSSSERFWFVKLLTFLKLLRLTTFTKYLDEMRDRKQYSIYKFRAFKHIIIFFIALLWATSVVYLLRRSRKDLLPAGEHTIFRGLLLSCFIALYNFFLVGYSHQYTNDMGDMIFALVCLTCGVVLSLILYAETVHMLNTNLSVSNKYQHMLQQLQEYIRYKQLPEQIRRRILYYFDFKFEKNYYKETEIMGTLSEHLRQDIILHACQNLVEKVDFFRDLPSGLLVRIVKGMKSEIYLTNDVIVKAGIIGDSMYFIASGTISVYTSSGKEICHLADGSHFGEVSLMMDNEKRIASVVAVECCELYNLSRKDFRKAIEPYPELNQRMRRLAQKRFQKTMQVMSEDSLDTESSTPTYSQRDNISV